MTWLFFDGLNSITAQGAVFSHTLAGKCYETGFFAGNFGSRNGKKWHKLSDIAL